jgi:hypothetical protein
MIMALNKYSSESFAVHIEGLVRDHGLSYMDAILHFCEQHQLEPETIVPHLSTKMKTAIQREGEALHLLKKRRGLPLDD